MVCSTKKQKLLTANIEADKNNCSLESYKISSTESVLPLKSTGISALFGNTGDVEALGEDNPTTNMFASFENESNFQTSPISVSNSIASLSYTHPSSSPIYTSTFDYKAQRASVAESDFRTKVLSSLAELTKSVEANRLAIIQLKSVILMNTGTVPASSTWSPTHLTPCKNFTNPSEQLRLSNSKTPVKYKYVRVLGFPLKNFIELENFSEKIKLAPSPQGMELTDGAQNIEREQFRAFIKEFENSKNLQSLLTEILVPKFGQHATLTQFKDTEVYKFMRIVISQWSDVKEAVGEKKNKWSSLSNNQKVREVVYHYLRLGRNDRTKKNKEVVQTSGNEGGKTVLKKDQHKDSLQGDTLTVDNGFDGPEKRSHVSQNDNS